MRHIVKQKIYKEEQKLKNKLYALEISLSRKQEKMLDKQQERQIKDNQKIIDRIERERTRKIKSYKEKTNKAIKNLEREDKGQKKVEYKGKPKGLKYYKKKAIDKFQEYIRHRDCNDENGYGIMIDKEEFRRFNGCDAGHYFPKHNYPQLIFNEDNVHAQTGGGNFRQLDKIGLFYEGRIIERIGQERYDKLREIARDTGLKTEAQNRNQKFYEDKYIEYNEKLKKLL